MSRRVYEKIPDEESSTVNPRKGVNFFSQLTFWWMNKILQAGAQRPLEESDFLPLQKEDETQLLTDTIQKLWRCQLKDCASSGRKPQLWKSVIMALSLRQFGVIFVTGVLECTCRILQTLLLGLLLSEMMSSQTYSRSALYVSVAGILLVTFIRSLVTHYLSYMLFMLGMRLKAALRGVIYLKVGHLLS